MECQMKISGLFPVAFILCACASAGAPQPFHMKAAAAYRVSLESPAGLEPMGPEYPGEWGLDAAASTLLRRARDYFAARDYTKAAVAYSYVLDETKDDHIRLVVIYNMALSYQLAGRFALAVQAYWGLREADGAFARRAGVDFRLGECFIMQHYWDEAVSLYTRIIVGDEYSAEEKGTARLRLESMEMEKAGSER
jgi:tetratricopeptide (TPR) repeat protein